MSPNDEDLTDGGPGTVDSITLELVNNRLDEIVREMQHVMYRTGYSTIIRDMKDGSAGICLADGRVVGQAFRLPLHCGSFTPTIEAIYEHFDLDEIREGDIFVTNDPYRSGANHTPDLMAATPVFHDGELRAFGCTIAHKPDVGGIAPGSTSAESREIYHEGLNLPPVKFRDGGEVDGTVERIIANNSRSPEVTVGDVRGQVRSTGTCVPKLLELYEEFGAATVEQATERLLDSTRQRISDAISPWDGEETVVGRLDTNVTGEDPITYRLTVSTEAGDGSLTFDFEGSDPQCAGPSNLQPHVARSACMTGLVEILDPTLPLNAAVSDLCAFRLPEASVVNPRHPAPCGNYAFSLCAVVHLSMRALSRFYTEQGVAEMSNKTSITVNYHDAGDGEGADRENVVQFEGFASGYGGNVGADGADCMATAYESNLQFTPVEIVETEFPTRVTRFEPIVDSAGAGEHRGGLGYTREYEMLAAADMTYQGTHHTTRAKGLAGGADAPTGSCTLNPGGPGERALDTLDTLDLSAGDVLRIERPGGAGYGDPHDRAVASVLEDVRRGFVSRAAASEQYGVAVVEEDGALAVDEAETAALRGEERADDSGE